MPRLLASLRTVFLALFLSLIVLLVGCDSEGSSTPPPTDDPALPFTLPDGFEGEIITDDLDLPTSIAFPPDGSNRLFVNELQSGRIRIIEDGTLRETPFAQLETNVEGGFPVDGENGLIGIAFDPNYATNRYVYVTYATRTDDGTFGAVGRFTDNNNQGENFTVLLDSIPSASGHQIESLAFGPDGNLYVSTGDAFKSEAAQDTTARTGKILRMKPDGSIPDDNPFPDSYTYALGFRNCFDLAFNSSGALFSTDNGPRFNDELNRIEAGGNYGWPDVTGESENPDVVDPLHVWPEIVAPTGMLFYEAQQFPAAYQGKLFLALFGATASQGPSERAKRIQVVDGLDAASGPSFQDFAVYDTQGEGNPIDITIGPDGSLYLSDIFQGRVFKISYAN